MANGQRNSREASTGAEVALEACIHGAGMQQKKLFRVVVNNADIHICNVQPILHRYRVSLPYAGAQLLVRHVRARAAL